jgi:poly(ADP-ribose) glycohydrolase ARH3
VTRSSDTWLERVQGAALGAACGDALGAPFEGSRTVVDSELTRWMSSHRVLRYTDDTAMTIALTKYLLTLGPAAPIEEQYLAEVFADHWRREPWRGYGAGPPHVSRLVLAGIHWAEAAVALFPPDGSFGNGGAMRVAPIACVATDLDTVATQARASARPTHMHPLGQDGAVIQAAAVWLALNSPPDAPLRIDDFIQQVVRLTQAGELQQKLHAAGELASSSAPADAARILGNGTAAVDSVPTALLAFLRHSDSYIDAVRFAVRVGGDTDTIAAMAGAIAGARHGITGIPPAWLGRLENEPRLRSLATQLGHKAESALDGRQYRHAQK